VLALRGQFCLVLTLAAALVAGAPAAVRAQGKLEARYSATLAGIPIGNGSWIVDITDTNYMAAATGVTTGLVRVFTGGQPAIRPTKSGLRSTMATSRTLGSIRRWMPTRTGCRS
jgi:hypothetical protein